MSGKWIGVDLDGLDELNEAVRIEAYLLREKDPKNNGNSGWRGVVNIYKGFQVVGRLENPRRWRKLRKASIDLRRLIKIIQAAQWAGIIDILEE